MNSFGAYLFVGDFPGNKGNPDALLHGAFNGPVTGKF
jgi:hypothetical protein